MNILQAKHLDQLLINNFLPANKPANTAVLVSPVLFLASFFMSPVKWLVI